MNDRELTSEYLAFENVALDQENQPVIDNTPLSPEVLRVEGAMFYSMASLLSDKLNLIGPGDYHNPDTDEKFTFFVPELHNGGKKGDINLSISSKYIGRITKKDGSAVELSFSRLSEDENGHPRYQKHSPFPTPYVLTLWMHMDSDTDAEHDRIHKESTENYDRSRTLVYFNQEGNLSIKSLIPEIQKFDKKALGDRNVETTSDGDVIDTPITARKIELIGYALSTLTSKFMDLDINDFKELDNTKKRLARV